MSSLTQVCSTPGICGRDGRPPTATRNRFALSSWWGAAPRSIDTPIVWGEVNRAHPSMRVT